MTALQFGLGAYLRSYAGSPEIQLLNRFLEASPSNVRERTGLLARQGTTLLATVGAGPIRKMYSKLGLFNGDLFAVSKNSLYRFSASGALTSIGGVIGSGNPKFTWDAGPGYQHLFVSDGELLQVYQGGTHASGTLKGSPATSLTVTARAIGVGGNSIATTVYSGATGLVWTGATLSGGSTTTYAKGTLSGVTPTNQVINIGGVYYDWNASVDSGSPAGTATHPYHANPTSGGDPFTAMMNLLNFTGTPGTDFSTAVPGPAAAVTAVASVIPTTQVIQIGSTFYSWNSAVDTGPPDGTAAHPFLANPTSGGDPYTAMANLLNFIGVPGTDFSTVIGGASTQVTAIANGGPPASSLALTAISEFADGNAIATLIYSGTGLSWSAATLTGGGTHSLIGVYVPTGEPINGLCTLDHYVMASVGKSNKMFFILPGEITIDTLNFFAKESNPDPIQDLVTIGDNFLAAGSGSVETWYATGDLNAPFAPIQGRTISRGIVDGTLVNVHDAAFFVGSDGVVYAFGGSGFERVSDNGIEERIRILTRQQAGVT